MTPGVWVLLYYICVPPAAGQRALSCEARQTSAPTCHQAAAQVEAGLVAGRLYFAAACVAVPSQDHQTRRAAPAR